jgi:hypothetical protein
MSRQANPDISILGADGLEQQNIIVDICCI